jgi:integrase
MSVRKRSWKNAGGERRTAYVVDYRDSAGGRHIETFHLKADAEARHDAVRPEVRAGIHTPHSKSMTVAAAGKLWLATADLAGLERATIDEYRRHLERHISPVLGTIKLTKLTAPIVREFVDGLRSAGMSAAMASKVRTSLGSILADAQERGKVSRNVVREAKRKRVPKAGSERGRRLKAGVDLPTPAEARAILEAASGRARPFIWLAIFTGLRSSELRGLRWSDIDFKKSELHVRQRADRYAAIGLPKSAAGERTVPIPPKVLGIMREWKLACPTGNLDLVFPTKAGTVQTRDDIVDWMLKPTMLAAGVSAIKKDPAGKVVHDEKGKPVRLAKYTGLHCLRHFYASWCINRKADGGLELPAKVVQERLGHSTVSMTLDVYGHLFARGDDSGELAAAERALIG